LDTEWLLSTLFDASLLSTSKAAGNGGSFFGRRVTPLETILSLAAGLPPAGAQWFVHHKSGARRSRHV